MRSSDELAVIAAIADDLAAGIWVATVPEGRFVYANRAFDDIMGMGAVTDIAAGQYAAPYGIYGRDGHLYPEDRMPFIRALKARATVVVDDIVIHRRDGGRVYVRAHAKPMFASDGTMTHIAIAFFDISREAEAEIARARAEDHLGRVVANAPIILFAIDAQGIITLCEGYALRRLGLTPEDVVGRSAFDFFPEVPQVGALCRRAVKGETASEVLDLGVAVYDAWMAPIRNDAGELIGAVGVSTDITERRRMEGRLAQVERLASVGLLAAGVAHEINNPLAYVISNLELASSDVAQILETLPPEARQDIDEKLGDALQGAERVRAIVRELKAFSRVDEHAMAPIDVRASLETTIRLANNEVRHHARLILDLAAVPRVVANEGRLGQLFLNLIVNAAHAIPQGAAESNEIRITTRVDSPGWVAIAISDTGAGIPREMLPKIFDPFFTTKPLGTGTGLGLSISHAIATEIGGRIEVESTVGKGTTFRVLLPCAGAVAPSIPPPKEACAPGLSAKRGTILVVDDEPLILKVVSALLTAEHDVVCESSARKAIDRIARGERFDLILCDVMMPDLTGIDFHAALTKLAPDQASAVLFLTGGAFTDESRAFLSSIPNATLEKPFNAESLLSQVRHRLK